MKKDPLIVAFIALACLALVSQLPAHAKEVKDVQVKVIMDEHQDAQVNVTDGTTNHDITLSQEALKNKEQLDAELAHLPEAIQAELKELFANFKFSGDKEAIALAIKDENLGTDSKKVVEIVKELEKDGDKHKVIIKKINSGSDTAVFLGSDGQHVMNLNDLESISKDAVKKTVIKLIKKGEWTSKEREEIEEALSDK